MVSLPAPKSRRRSRKVVGDFRVKNEKLVFDFRTPPGKPAEGWLTEQRAHRHRLRVGDVERLEENSMPRSARSSPVKFIQLISQG